MDAGLRFENSAGSYMGADDAHRHIHQMQDIVSHRSEEYSIKSLCPSRANYDACNAPFINESGNLCTG